MKPLVCLLSLLFCTSAAAAAAKIDCSTLVVEPYWAMSYSSVEAFPNPTQRFRVDFFDIKKPFDFNNCGIVIHADTKEFRIKAKSTDALLNVMHQISSWEFDILGVTTVAGKTKHPYAAILRIGLPNIVNKKVSITAYPKGTYLPKDALMAVRADGGKLLPVIYNGTFRDVGVDPKVKTLEFYIKVGKPLLWEGMRFNVSNSEMIFYKKMPFPSR